jgi:hypothetical protein
MTAVRRASGPGDRGGDLRDDRLVLSRQRADGPDLHRAAELELPLRALEPERNGVDDALAVLPGRRARRRRTRA